MRVDTCEPSYRRDFNVFHLGVTASDRHNQFEVFPPRRRALEIPRLDEIAWRLNLDLN